MSTSLLYHAFGIQGYRYVRTAYVAGQTIFTLGQEPDNCRCSACGSAHVGVGWDLVKDVQKRDLSRRYAKPKLKHLRRIAIDEIAVAKGHRYMTVVMDLDSGAVVFVGDGKGADALKPFWKRLRPSGAKIAAVAMDMSAAYRGAVSAHLKTAVIVFDHFHVIKPFNDKL